MQLDRNPPSAELQFCGKRFPALIAREGRTAAERFIEFFAANIRNLNTRAAYATATTRFCEWAEVHKFTLRDLRPIHVAAYIELLGERLAPPTVKQHLAAIRMLMDWLVLGQVIPMNPAASVRGPKHVVKRGKTPALEASEARQLLDSIGTQRLIDLRDRALISVMIYSFARISAVLGMRVSDYYRVGKRRWIRLHEKGGKFHEVPVHHHMEDALDEYLDAAGEHMLEEGPLFRSMVTRTEKSSSRALSRSDALRMVKRRAAEANLPSSTSCHTFRATGITAFLSNGGSIERAQAIAGHESPKTTKLYDRSEDALTLAEIERIQI